MDQQDLLQKTPDVLDEYDGIIMYIDYEPDNLLSIIQMLFCTDKKIHLIFPLTNLDQYELFETMIKNFKMVVNRDTSIGINYEINDETDTINILSKCESVLLCVFRNISPIMSNQLSNFRVKQEQCTLLFSKEKYFLNKIEVFTYFKTMYIFDKKYAYISSSISTFNNYTIFLNFLEDYLEKHKVFKEWLHLVETKNQMVKQNCILERKKYYSYSMIDHYSRIIKGIELDKHQLVIGSYGALICFLLKNCFSFKLSITSFKNCNNSYKNIDKETMKILEDKIHVFDNRKKTVFKEKISDLLFSLFYNLFED